MFSTIFSAAPAPCTLVGAITNSTKGNLLSATEIISFTAAPSGAVTNPIFLGNAGIDFLYCSSNKPSSNNFLFSLSKAA